jgi:hypothetical protein
MIDFEPRCQKQVAKLDMVTVGCICVSLDGTVRIRLTHRVCSFDNDSEGVQAC